MVEGAEGEEPSSGQWQRWLTEPRRGRGQERCEPPVPHSAERRPSVEAGSGDTAHSGNSHHQARPQPEQASTTASFKAAENSKSSLVGSRKIPSRTVISPRATHFLSRDQAYPQGKVVIKVTQRSRLHTSVPRPQKCPTFRLHNRGRPSLKSKGDVPRGAWRATKQPATSEENKHHSAPQGTSLARHLCQGGQVFQHVTKLGKGAGF